MIQLNAMRGSVLRLPVATTSKRPPRFGNEPDKQPKPEANATGDDTLKPAIDELKPVKPAPARIDPYKAYVPGLEGIVGGKTAISEINPKVHSLIYRGYDIRELVEKSTFEEVTYLLHHGELPKADQLKAFEQKIRTQRDLPVPVLMALHQVPKRASAMDVLRTGVSMLAHFDPQIDDNSHDANIEKSIRLMARMPTLVAAAYRISQGKPAVKPDPALSQSENFLYMMTGQKPDDRTTKLFDAIQIIYAEHGFNASTYASRVTTSTLSDVYSGVVSAIGTLKGPLHGGANQEVMKMLLEIGKVENAEPWVKNALVQKKKIMGFGHRVYKNGDTRAPILKKMAEAFSKHKGNMAWYEMADKVETAMKKEKGLFPNVDYHTAYIYYLMDLPIDLYTPMFAMSRVAGWTAHIAEQLDNNRLIRPEALYDGKPLRSYVPVDKR